VSDTKEIQGKPLVNHRWNLPSIEAMLDEMLREWEPGDHPDFSGPDGYERLRNAFCHFAHSLMRELSWHLEKAAGRGITEALALIRNPEYYETVKRRRSRAIQKGKEWRQKQEVEDKERERRRRGELSEEERIDELGRIACQLDYHQREIDKLTIRKSKVEGTSPVAFVKTEPSTRPNLGGEDEWPDRISFD
jgi:hypothetical protein